MNALQRANITGANTVIGGVPLRVINDSAMQPKGGGGGPLGGGGPNNSSGGPSVPTAGESFKVSFLIQVLFARLPSNLRDHVAFRHFYTDELDAGAHALCIKYFTLLVLYFCTVFRLEGRRRHYLEQPTERSGREFAAAHKRAQTVFQELSTTYSAIIMRYSRHSEIQYTARHAILVKGRTNGKSYTGGFKNINQMLEVKEPAFKFESEDFLFYEHLSAFALQIVKMAFAEDTVMKERAAAQVSEMFRSRSFTFNPQRRRVEVRALERSLDSDSVSLKENTAQIAELLTPHDPRIIVKYANQQRTPFIQTKFPGGTSFMKYQRPKPSGIAKAEPTKIEKQYTIESEHANFPLEHPAMYRINLWHQKKKAKNERSVKSMRSSGGVDASNNGKGVGGGRFATPEPSRGGNNVFGVGSPTASVHASPTPTPSPQQQTSASPTAVGSGLAAANAKRVQTPPIFIPQGGLHNHNNNANATTTNTTAANTSRVQSTGPSRCQSGFLGGGGGGLPSSRSDHTSTASGNNNTNNLPPIRGNNHSHGTATEPSSLNATGRNQHINSVGGGGAAASGGENGENNTASATEYNHGNTAASLGSPKGNSKSEADRLELEEREAKFYEIFLLPRLFSTHAATSGIGLGGHNPAAIAGAAAVHNHAVAAAAAATTSKAPPPLPYHLVDPTSPLTTADYKAALLTVIEAWNSFDLSQEIDAVYQAVANGVVVKDLSLPSDIMLCYDELGVLYVNEKDGTPLNLS